MTASFSCARAWLIAGIVATGATIGCQPSAEQKVKDAFRREFRENGRRVAFFYAQFMSSPMKPVGPEGFSGPKNEAELRAFIAASPAVALEDMGIRNSMSPDLFTSERDGQPFRVRYGIRGSLSTTYVLLCEAKGVNGRVTVFKSDGSSAEVSAEEADACMAGDHDAAYDRGDAI
jgi:hypothetical protein